MNPVSNSLPAQMPGIDVAFGLKQCLGNPNMLQSLLRKFWKDYSNTCDELNNREPAEQNLLFHNIRGGAINLGLSRLAEQCRELRAFQNPPGVLPTEVHQRFQLELEKVASSIKTLASFR